MHKLFSLAALLALAATRPALAQVPRVSAGTSATVPATPAVPQTGSVSDAGSRSVTLPAPAVPAYPNGYTDKHAGTGGSPSGTFPNGVPQRDIDNGTGHNDQPRAGQAQAGAQPTRSIFRGSKRRAQQ